MAAKPTQNILLTTYPAHKSQNSGDDLITQSCIKLIRSRNPDFEPIIRFREAPLDGLSAKKVKNVIAPGFSVINNVYPDIFGLYKDLDRLKNFYPVGCSFQHPSPTHEMYQKVPYNDETINFLKLLVEKFGPLPCRDDLIVNMLNDRFGITSYYSGDLAIYDEDYINKDFTPPKEIKSIVVTLQHHLKYIEQSIDLLKKIQRRFPDAKLYVAHHSKPSGIATTIAARATELGYEVLNTFGGFQNIERYKDIDLHIGYRLHGHIAFLRYRKPSFLLVEDARAFGFSQTEGTGTGCIQALDTLTNTPDDSAPDRMMELLQSHLDNNFQDFQQVFDFVDHIYASRISKYFDELASKTLTL